jgi:DNA modification methylase
MDYLDFLSTKQLVVRPVGRAVDAGSIHPMLFPFQRDLTTWAVRKGRCAIFADTGLGKTFMQVEWARIIGETTLIVAPLSVARQTVREAAKIGVDVHYTRSGDDVTDGLNITNYEMLDKFQADRFGAVVLDESSILKSLDGKTRQKLIEMFAFTPYRLCCSATPAPNDISEIANHAEFIGIMSRADMLATFFVHDDNGWRLKGHAKEPFFRWMASWGMSIHKPSDLGYEDDGYILPKLTIAPAWVRTDYRPEDQLFFTGLNGITGRSQVRKATIGERVDAASEIVNAGDGQCIVWCGLNDEQDAMAAAIPDAVSVHGSMSLEEKTAAIEAFQDGRYRVMVTKPKIAGFGMNFQNANRMVFVGLSDSWEAYYQCIRRCWRFGQTKPVTVSIVLSEIEDAIYQNILRKEREAEDMSQQLISNLAEFEKEEISTTPISEWTYREADASGENWRLMLGDSAERMAEVADEAVDLSVFSPPFMSLYTYSPTERDIGNSRNGAEFFAHFGFIIDHLLRVTKPGRNCCVHVADVPAMLVRDGYVGLKDFPGMTVKAFEERGWIYHGRVTIDKNPQVQALRTKSKGLLFSQMEKDSSWSRPALADYILIFRKPGENHVPVLPDITRQQWILWARAVWYAADYAPGSFSDNGGSSKSGFGAADGIAETDTLQYTTARSEDDERHICPLQLGTIERCIRLWSNAGETVLSPFAGIGSEGYVAIEHGRKFIGIELKPEYFKVAAKNLA